MLCFAYRDRKKNGRDDQFLKRMEHIKFGSASHFSSFSYEHKSTWDCIGVQRPFIPLPCLGLGSKNQEKSTLWWLCLISQSLFSILEAHKKDD